MSHPSTLMLIATRSAAVILVALMLVGCGGNSVTGTYVMERELPGMGMKATMTLDFKSNGTVTMTGGSKIGDVTDEQTLAGTYVVKGEQIELTIDGETTVLHLDGKTLYSKEPGMKDFRFTKK